MGLGIVRQIDAHGVTLVDLSKESGEDQYTAAMELLGALVNAQQQGTLEMRLAQHAKPKRLIIDELCSMPLEPAAGQLIFPLPSRCFE